MRIVRLVVARCGAVYVDDSRITDRSTKPWGGSPTVFEVSVPDDEVVTTLERNGFAHLLRKIDVEPYMSKAKVTK